MAKRGRKPKATAVQEANGAYKKDPQRRPTQEIKAAVERPMAPEIVSRCDKTLAVWYNTCDTLEEIGLLSKTDTILLVQFVIAYAEWLKMAAYIQENGHANPDGKTAPESVAFFKLSDKVCKLIPEFGLSPSSRASLAPAIFGRGAEEKAPKDMGSLAEGLKRGRQG